MNMPKNHGRLTPSTSLHERAATHLTNEDTGNDGQGEIYHLLSFVDNISSCVILPDLHFLFYVHKSAPMVPPLDAL